MYRNTVPLQGMFNSSRMMCRLFMTAVILYATVCSCEQEGHHELCYPNRFSHDSVVCVCNVTHCADIGRIHPEDGHILMYQSTLEGQRFKKSVLHFGSNGTANLTLKLGDRTLHKIFGFGSSFTDSAGVNWMSLPEGLRDRLIGAYYSVEGSEYSMGRIPMAGCEFSTRDYTYADTKDDFEMNNFSLALEDINYKLPMVKKANDFAKEEVLYIGSPFSPPGWMKDTGTTAGPSRMKGDPGGPYYKAWALYFVKFFQEYKMNGVDIWGFTIQNEPTSGHYPLWKWQTMRLTPDVERDFIKNDLGPVLFNATEGKIKLMILDDNTYVLPWWAMVVYRDEDAAKYVAGLAVHWYYNQQTNPEALNFTYHLDPTKFILGTEACEGFQDHRVHLGTKLARQGWVWLGTVQCFPVDSQPTFNIHGIAFCITS